MKFLFQDPLWGMNLDGKQISVGHQGFSFYSIAKNSNSKLDPSGCLQREGGMPDTNKELRARLSEKAFMSHFNIEFQRAYT